MAYVLGAVCGLLWGGLAALLNFQISKRSIEAGKNAGLMGANLLRVAVDAAALGAVFLLRKVLPFSYETMLVCTAIGLSLVTIFCAYRLSAKLMEKKDKD